MTCVVSRKRDRRGRRPVLRPFTHGSLQMWELGRADEGEQQHKVKRGTGTVYVYGDGTNTETAHRSSPAKQARMVNNIPTQLLKEAFRLRFAPGTPSDAMSILSDDEKFTLIQVPFTIGRSFVQDLRLAIYSAMIYSAPVITDVYLAFLGQVAHCQASRLLCTTPDLRRGAKALQVLRTVDITSPHEALCILLLGQALFVFEILTGCFTTSAHSIVQSALISATPWYPALSGVPALDTVTLCPIFLDLVGCLVYRRVPIVQSKSPGRIVVDRYVGLCSTLLPYLHLLCEQSHAAKSNLVPFQFGSASRKGPEDCYANIEKAVSAWTPQAPDDFISAYDRVEREMMMTQAHAYRFAALLLTHRLRFPLGIQDALAPHYAHCIIHEIKSFFDQPGTPGARAFPITFPFFISMLEVEGLGEDLLDKLLVFPIQSFCMKKLHSFVKHVRRMKASGYGGLWFDLVESDLTYAIIP